MLENELRDRLKKRDILLMTHIVMGYPSFEDSFKIVEAMVQAGVDLMELQIPFSEPIADGPVILRANQMALSRGATVMKCLDVAGEMAQTFDIPFLCMTYYNVLFKRGLSQSARDLADRGLRGVIVPDCPPEEGEEYLEAMEAYGLSPIFIFSPTSSDERMRMLGRLGKGFIYCVARKGVTGKKTDFSGDITGYLDRCRRATTLPLAVGFGLRDREDVAFLKGKAEIAVIGTETIRVMEDKGVAGVGEFIGGLR